jgi:hypothetical protein
MQLKGSTKNPIIGEAFPDRHGMMRWRLDPSFADWVWGAPSKHPRELWLQMRDEDLEPAPSNAIIAKAPEFTDEHQRAMLVDWLDEESVGTLDSRTAVELHDHITPEPRSILIFHLHHFGSRAKI